LEKRLEKGLAEDWMLFFSIFLARSPSSVCNQHAMEEQEQVEHDHRVEKKKPSGRLRAITEEMVAKYYHYPVSEAAEFLSAAILVLNGGHISKKNADQVGCEEHHLQQYVQSQMLTRHSSTHLW
jgi:hypothetical protein